MTPPDKNEVIKILQQISGLLTLKGEAVFKTRSYDKAAETLTAMTDDLAAVVAADKLEALDGFGKSLSAKVKELMTTGKMAFFEDLKKEYPLTLLDIGQVPGVGPKKVVQFYKELKVANLADLEQACIDHKIMALKGCGEKTEQTILEGLQLLKKHSGRTPLWKARPVAEAVLEHVRKAPHIVRAEIGGSTRRFAETVGDVDIISSVTKQEQADEVMKHFLTYPGIDKVLGSGHTKTSVLLMDGFQLDLRVIEDHDFGTALHHFTGSKAHHIELRQLALKQNKMLSEYGIHKLKPDGSQGDKIKINTEQELYAELGLEFVPPEMREGKGEIELAAKKALGHIIERSDIKGSTHQHTTASDGKNTLEEMARGAKALGLTYLTITEHSQAASYAGGLKVDALKAQWAEIDRVNKLKIGVKLLKGAEVDILEDGSLDYPDDVLAKLEVVIASVHSRHKMDSVQMTARIAKALDNKHVHIWGHPTGRLIGSRDPVELDMDALLTKAAKNGVAVEINGTPERLDLSADHARLALTKGVKLVLSTDAHSVEGLDHLRYAVGTARRAGVTREQVLNALDEKAFLKALHRA